MMQKKSKAALLLTLLFVSAFSAFVYSIPYVHATTGTFGNTGQTSINTHNTAALIESTQYSPASDGTINTITVDIRRNDQKSTPFTVEVALFLDVDGVLAHATLVTYGENTGAVAATLTWITVSVTPATVSSASHYYLYFWCEATNYDFGETSGSNEQKITSPAYPPNNPAGANSAYNTALPSIYATYTVGSAGWTKNVNGISNSQIGSINGVSKSQIYSVNGVT